MPATGISLLIMVWLTLDEIATLDDLFLRGHRFICALRTEAPVGTALHAVKVPPRLSEAIVASMSEQLFGGGAIVLDERAGHDLRVRTARGRRLNVAVKGTGEGDWVSITRSDRRADVVIWVDYSDRLRDASRPVAVHRIPATRLVAAGDRAFLRRVARGCPRVLVRPQLCR